MARSGILFTSIADNPFGTNYPDGADDAWGEDLNPQPNYAEACSRDNTRVREGNYSWRFHIEDAWPVWTGNNNHRSELHQSNRILMNVGNDYWYGCSLFIPDNTNCRNMGSDTATLASVLQFHGNGSEGSSHIHCYNHGIYLLWRPNETRYRLMDIPYGEWVDFVFHMRLANNNTGFLKVWAGTASENIQPTDPPKHERYNIDTMTGSAVLYYNKIGIYRESINGHKADGSTGGLLQYTRDGPYTYAEHNIDSVRIGDSSSDFLSVKPGDESSPPVVEDIITEIPDLIHDGEVGVTIQLDGTIAATGKKVWLEQEIDGQSTMVEQVVTAEDATSVTFNCDYQDILRNGLANLHVGDPQ